MGLGGLFKKVFSPTRLKKRTFDPEKVDIQDITLPKIIYNLDIKLVKSMVKEEIATYKSLGYSSSIATNLDVKSYHSFQMGNILRYLQSDEDLFIPNKEKIFPKFILNIAKKSLMYKVFEIFDRYDRIIAKNLTAKELTTQLQWTPVEIGYILYYSTVYKDDA